MADNPTRAIELLFVEDSQEDIELALRALKSDGVQTRARHVDCEAGLREALGAARPDAVLSDFSMPSFDGLQALRIVREVAPEVPFIFVSGTIGEERAIEAIRMGATDYILKSNMRRLGTAVKRALSEAAERRQYEARIRYLANYDGLTDLPNRSLLADRSTQAIAHARRGEGMCGLLVLNIDRFTVLNEALGNAAGDALLRQFAERLRGCASEGDTLARVGADTFALLVAGLPRADAMTGIACHVQETVAAPFIIEGREVLVTASLGASTYPRDAADIEGLLGNADAAMRRVKAAGGNGFQYYAAAMTSEAAERLELESALRAAPKRGQLELHYQPQVDVASGQIAGLEALMRWRHPQRGSVSPAQFIPIAEESDTINALGEWALHAACRQLAEWDAEGHGVGRIAVNVSARQFRSPGFADLVARTLREHGLHASRLELELTEGMLIEKREEAAAILNRLKAIGVQIALDDFGTGYSSLSYLSSLPVDCLKIDRSFVAQATRGGRHADIAQAVISIGHTLGMRVLAEGVETPEQLEFLRRHGCNEYQGYLFSRPQPAESIAPLLDGAASLL